MNGYKHIVRELLRDETGQDLLEYAIVAGLVGLGAVVSFGNLDTRIKGAFNSIGNQLTNAV